MDKKQQSDDSKKSESGSSRSKSSSNSSSARSSSSHGSSNRSSSNSYSSKHSDSNQSRKTRDLPIQSSSCESDSSWQCKICSTKLQSENAFLKHLTFSHYKERIVREVKSPSKTLTCDNNSSSEMTENEKTKDLLLRYGLQEKLSYKYYQEEEINKSQKLKPECSYSICKICDIKFKKKKMLLDHLTLKHFAKTLNEKLPKGKPHKCPQKDCYKIKSDSQELLLHYGSVHKKAWTFYKKHPKYLESERLESMFTPKVKLPNAPKLNKLKAVVSPYNPLSEKQKSDMVASIGNASRDPAGSHASIPSSRSLSSTNSSVLSISSENSPVSGGSPSTRIRIDYLESRIRSLESRQKNKLKEKKAEFDRWLAAKDSTLKEEQIKNRLLEEKLAEADSLVSELKSQLDLVHQSLSKAEENLTLKKKQTEELLALKLENERQMEEKEVERINSYEELYQKEKELESTLEKLALSEKKLNLKQKEKFDNDGESLHSDFIGVDTDVEEKNEQLQNVEKENKERNTEIQLLKSERQDLKKYIADLTKTSEKEISDLKKKIKTIGKADVDKASFKALEKEKKDLAKKAKTLELTLSEWETRQFTNVKLISGLEKERDSLQLKLKEMKDGNLSHEDQLYWKDVTIKNSNKEIESLKTHTNKLSTEISNLKVELSKTKERVEICKGEGADTGSNDTLINTISQRDGEIKHLKITLDNKIKNHAKLHISLQDLKIDLKKNKVEKEKLEKEKKKYLTKMEDMEEQLKNYAMEIKEQCKLIEELRGGKQKKVNHSKDSRIEMIIQNQVLKDMDTVIQLREKGVSPEEEFSSTILQDEGMDGNDSIVSSPLTIETDELIQYPNSDHSYPLSSPPILSPPGFKTTRQSNVVSKCSRKRKASSAKKKVRQESFTSSGNDFQDSAYIDIDNTNQGILNDSYDSESSDNSKKGLEKGKLISNKNNKRSMKSQDIKIEVDLLPTKRLKKSPTVSKDEVNIETVSSSNLCVVKNEHNLKTSLKACGSKCAATTKLEVVSRRQKVSKKKKRRKCAPKSALVDVTHEYEEEEEASDYVCGVCESWDVPEHLAKHIGQTTEWIGCDCDRWFHKQCTGMKKFTTKFSCKSLKMDCLDTVIPITMDSINVM